jgi:peptidoglycan-associated lipoprotein
MTRRFSVVAIIMMAFITLAGVSACGKKKPPVARATPPPPGSSTSGSRPPAPPEPVVEPEPVPVPPEPTIDSSDSSNRSLDEINKQGLLQPVFFELDGAELSAEAQASLTANAETLKKNPTWVISIEGHCDERGTAEYNLALGERRALSTRSYLVSLGISQDRLRTVSYGKEFPFDPNHTESAWAKNRRAHFVVTAK